MPPKEAVLIKILKDHQGPQPLINSCTSALRASVSIRGPRQVVSVGKSKANKARVGEAAAGSTQIIDWVRCSDRFLLAPPPYQEANRRWACQAGNNKRPELPRPLHRPSCFALITHFDPDSRTWQVPQYFRLGVKHKGDSPLQCVLHSHIAALGEADSCRPRKRAPTRNQP